MYRLKIVITLLLFSFMILSTTHGLAQHSDNSETDIIASIESEQIKFKSSFVENTSYADYDLIYQQMYWEIDPAIRYIQGEITSYFKSNTENLSEIEFDLKNELEIDSIVQNGDQNQFLHNNNKIKIYLHSILSENDIDSLKIYYKGVPSGSGFGSFVKSEHNDIPVIWTLSEPYGARDWWPCKQSLVDKIDSIDIIVKTPDAYRTASNGVLVSDEVSKG